MRAVMPGGGCAVQGVMGAIMAGCGRIQGITSEYPGTREGGVGDEGFIDSCCFPMVVRI